MPEVGIRPAVCLSVVAVDDELSSSMSQVVRPPPIFAHSSAPAVRALDLGGAPVARVESGA
jgi:hypothetical protein